MLSYIPLNSWFLILKISSSSIIFFFFLTEKFLSQNFPIFFLNISFTWKFESEENISLQVSVIIVKFQK